MQLRPPVRHRRLCRLLIAVPLLLGALVLNGCTSGFVYNRLDTLATWYFESLVSLNDGQRNELRDWLERTLAWHRSSELTRYASFLSDVSTSIAQPGDRSKYDAIRERFQNLLSDLIRKTAPDASRLLVRLSPQQVNELIENLEEKSRESTEKNAEALADNEWHSEQTQDIVKQMKRWTGSVSSQQKQIIGKHVLTLEPTFLEWAESQKAWRVALRDALVGPEVTHSATPPRRVLALLEDPEQHWTPEYSQKIGRNRERYQDMLMELDATLTPKQREHLRGELHELSQQLTRLARG